MQYCQMQHWHHAMRVSCFARFFLSDVEPRDYSPRTWSEHSERERNLHARKMIATVLVFPQRGPPCLPESVGTPACLTVLFLASILQNCQAGQPFKLAI